MSRTRISKESLEFAKTGFKSKDDKGFKEIMSDFLNMKNLVKYEGTQEALGALWPMFTDKTSGTTFMVRKGEKLKNVWDSITGKMR